MGKNFEDELLGLMRGLKEINNAIHTKKTRLSYSRAIQAREIQEARIEFFKRGYNCKDKEIKQQRHL